MSLKERLSQEDYDTVVALIKLAKEQGNGHPGRAVLAGLTKSLTAWCAAIVFFAPDVLPLMQESLPQIIGQPATNTVIALAAKVVAIATLYGRIRARALGT